MALLGFSDVEFNNNGHHLLIIVLLGVFLRAGWESTVRHPNRLSNLRSDFEW